jgi:hypothetical protein
MVATSYVKQPIAFRCCRIRRRYFCRPHRDSGTASTASMRNLWIIAWNSGIAPIVSQDS